MGIETEKEKEETGLNEKKEIHSKGEKRVIELWAWNIQFFRKKNS